MRYEQHGRLSLPIRVLLVSAVLLVLTGCDSSRPVYEYEYDSVYLKDLAAKDGGVAKAPITITLRLEQKANSLFVRSKIVDATGKTEFGTATLPCTVFDQGNFTCGSDASEGLTMKDGQLTSYHDREPITWRRHVCILGHRAI
jgi:hypothetical protein